MGGAWRATNQTISKQHVGGAMEKKDREPSSLRAGLLDCPRTLPNQNGPNIPSCDRRIFIASGLTIYFVESNATVRLSI